MSQHQAVLDVIPSPGVWLGWGVFTGVVGVLRGCLRAEVGAGGAAKKGVSVTRRRNRTFTTPHSNYTLEWLDCGGN